MAENSKKKLEGLFFGILQINMPHRPPWQSHPVTILDVVQAAYCQETIHGLFTRREKG